MNLPSFNSLRLRFLFAAFLWVTIATIVAGFVISGLYRAHLTAKFHNELEIHLIELVRLTDTDVDGNPMLDRPLSDPRFQQVGSGFYWQIERTGYTPVTSMALSGNLMNSQYADGPQEKSGWIDGPFGQVMACGIIAPSRTGGTPLRFSVAAERRLLESEIADFNRDLALSLTAFAALMLIGATLQIRYGLRPARALADDIAHLREGKTARLSTDVPSEFGPIVTRLNALLDSQAALITRGRVEAGNLAHGLRTPLALIGSEAEQLESRKSEMASKFILDQCHKIQRQIDYHMKRASAAGTRLTSYVSNISVMAQQIVSAMKRLYAHKSLTFVVDIPTNITVNCDEGDLSEILSNLIDNACKWTSRTVTISARSTDSEVVVEVRDDGPGIAPERRAEVFDVGARLDETKTGSGLGLPISRDLARLYGGELELSHGPNGGLLACLRLPKAVL